MTHEKLIQWGRNEFEKGSSLHDIEKHLIRKGLKQEDALKLLHHITAFEHKVYKESERIIKKTRIIPLFILLFVFALVALFFAMKGKN